MGAKKQIKVAYCKEKSTLQIPLFFFQASRKKEITHRWTSEDGTECKIYCQCGRGIPGSLEQDVYAAIMRLWILQGMQERGVYLTIIDITKSLGLNIRSWSDKIKKSLLKLGLAKYELERCFILQGPDGARQVDRVSQFSLIDSADVISITGRGKKKEKAWLKFPSEVRNNLLYKYYQLLDFDLYKSIKPTGMPRRLYEYLEKRKYHGQGGEFCIREDLLCVWMPVTNKNKTERWKTIEKAAEALVKVGYLSKYWRDKKKKVWHFIYASAVPKPKQLSKPKPPAPAPKQIPPPQELDSMISECRDWLETIRGFGPARIKKITSTQEVHCYREVRAEYERQQEQIQSPCRWISAAFRDAYKQVKTKQKPSKDEFAKRYRETLWKWYDIMRPHDKEAFLKRHMSEALDWALKDNDEEAIRNLVSHAVKEEYGQEVEDYVRSRMEAGPDEFDFGQGQ